MRFPVIVPVLLTTALSMYACGRSDPPPEPAADGQTLVTVNGTPITRTDLFAYAGFDPLPPGATGSVLEELVNLELLRQEALRQGIEQEAEIRMILRNIETNLLASQVIERRLAQTRLTDAQIRAEFLGQVEALGTTEFRASHILVDTEAQAIDLIAQLDAGADFGQLAAQHSLDTSAQQGGDLGWFVPKQMVPEFAAAVQGLDPGSHTEQPVRTAFGAHVILLRETRDIVHPTLDEVRGQIEEILQTRALQAYVDELRNSAEIRFAAPIED